MRQFFVNLWAAFVDVLEFLERQWLFSYEGDFYRQCQRCHISHHAKYLGRDDEANLRLGWWVLNPNVKDPKPCRCHKYARILEKQE